MQCSRCKLVEMRVEKVVNNIATHKCPKCGAEADAEIQDDED